MKMSKTDLHFNQVEVRRKRQAPLSSPEGAHIFPVTSHEPKYDHRTQLAAREAMCLAKIKEDSITNKNTREIKTRGTLASIKSIDRNFSN